MNYTIINADSASALTQFPDNHFHSIVCDPPYGIDFLGKAWDHNTGDRAVYEQCLRVLRPGGHILAFSAARTYHHLAMTLEQVGFEIRDQIMWIYGSGFPKSQDVGRTIQKSLGVKQTRQIRQHDIRNNGLLEKQGTTTLEQVVVTDPVAQAWSGWGTNLKPAHEPICMARKPMPVSVARNVQQWGTGALNIDATRIEWDDETKERNEKINASGGQKIGIGIKRYGNIGGEKQSGDERVMINEQGRWPANIIMDPEAGTILDQQAPAVGNLFGGSRNKDSVTGTGHSLTRAKHQGETNGICDGLAGASRFFYCAQPDEPNTGPGRFPANIIHDGSPEVVEQFPYTVSGGVKPEYANKNSNEVFGSTYPSGRNSSLGTFESNEGSAARFFYCAKVNKRERNIGVENTHPTVKPVDLMRYLIKLVTPPGGRVLDPFTGSGSTGMAAVELGHEFVGIEREPAYAQIAQQRIAAWHKQCYPLPAELFEETA